MLLQKAHFCDGKPTQPPLRSCPRFVPLCCALLLSMTKGGASVKRNGNFVARRIALPSVPDLLSRASPVEISLRRITTPVSTASVTQVATVKTKKKKRTTKSPGFYYGIGDNMIHLNSTRVAPWGPSSSRSTGYYYGIVESMIPRQGPRQPSPPKLPSVPKAKPDQKKQPAMKGPARYPPSPLDGEDLSKTAAALADVMGETLLELREMREDIANLRAEMQRMKRRMGEPSLLEEELEEEEGEADEGRQGRFAERPTEGDEDRQDVLMGGIGTMMHRMRRQREFDKIGLEVERWAERLLFKETGEANGWKEIPCNKMVKGKFNREGTTQCYLKWMTDPRGKYARKNGGYKEFPCIKCYATIDAPIDDVCAYLAEEKRMAEYNELVVANRDLEEISPHSKICWSQCPQILFVKPRDFVTYCHHRWLRDGTQVVVNQACEHPDAPGVDDEKEGKVCRAYALRGANFIMKDPDDSNKTRFALLAHADPGGGLPTWACRTVVKAVVPIEPFKLFHNINKCIKRAGPCAPQVEMVSSMPGRITKPAGLSQMGYACFWPNGGGLKEGLVHRGHPTHSGPGGEKGASKADEQQSRDGERSRSNEDGPSDSKATKR